MADMLQAGAAFLAAQNKAHMSQTVTYQRGDATVELKAKIGRTQRASQDTFGAQVSWEARDYIVQGDDLVLDGERVTPQEGDRITETLGGNTLTYEVQSFPGEPCFRFADAYRIELRIHTRQIAEESSS